jgi:hypothetical protein
VATTGVQFTQIFQVLAPKEETPKESAPQGTQTPEAAPKPAPAPAPAPAEKDKSS